MPGADTLTVRRFFSRTGVLSRCHPGYEFRPGQLEMAEAVEAALSDKRHLIVEAGTGTGKTLAYLVPAILSGKRVVISTGTKNLQEQLFYKDVPFLQKHLGGDLQVCYMKGRSNYACRQKIYDAEKEAVLDGLEEVADFEIIRNWEKTTETGDRAEIKTLPEKSTTWAKVDARRDLCTGQKCAQFERCFLTLMHQRAYESDIIIVNHHLFFADLAVKEQEYAGIIPEYAAVMLDEAHEIEDVAGQYFGISVSNYQFEELKRDIGAIAQRKAFGSHELDRILIAVGDAAARFFALFEGFMGRSGFHEQEAFVEQYEEQYGDVLHGLELIAAHLELIKDAPEEVIPLFNRCRATSEEPGVVDGGQRSPLRLLGGAPGPRLLPPGNADRRLATARREALRSRGHRDSGIGYARGGGQLRFFLQAARTRCGALADRSRAFRLPEPGALLRAAAAARSPAPGVRAGRLR